MSNDTEIPAPVVDNFCTPKNHDFYTHNPYHYLNVSKQEIRLLEFEESTNDEDLRLTLHQPIDLASDDAPPYCALSYFAGKHSDTEVVWVDGVSFNAFANLGAALRQVRTARNSEADSVKDGPMLLWADQICINQSNPDERCHQVRFMRHIYENAHMVLACLGSDDATHGRWRAGAQWLADMLDSHDVGNMSEIAFKETKIYVNNEPCVDFLHDDSMRKWLDFKGLAASVWWTRGWVCQEVICARRAVVFFGDTSIDMEVLGSAISLINSVDKSITMRALHEKLTPQELALRPILGAGAYLSFATFMMLGQIMWRRGEKLDILNILTQAMSSNFTDLRDKIYAFVGLADPKYVITPDYQKDVGSVYQSITKKIICQQRRLDVLYFVSGRDEQALSNLPSWTPDWSAWHDSCIIYDSRFDRPPFRASAGRKLPTALLPTHVVTDGVLRLQGIFVDSLAHATTNIVWETYGSSEAFFDELARVAEIDSSALSHPKPIDAAAVYPFNTSINVAQALWRVLTRGQPIAQTLEDCVGRLDQGQNDNVFFDAILAATRTADIAVVFRSRNGYLGVAKKPAKLQCDDSIWILLGSNAPVVLRRISDYYIFLGEAYVEGLMYGEGMERMRAGALLVETIDVH